MFISYSYLYDPRASIYIYIYPDRFFRPSHESTLSAGAGLLLAFLVCSMLFTPTPQKASSSLRPFLLEPACARFSSEMEINTWQVGERQYTWGIW